MSASVLVHTPQPWEFDEHGNPRRFESDADYRDALNAYYSEEYAGLSPPIDGAEIFDMPQPEWALEDMIQDKGLTLIHAKQGSGKTFVALDWAFTLSHPTMSTWMGKRRTKRFRPMYLMTEGMSHLPFRAKAWELGQGTSIAKSGEGVVFQRTSVRMQRSNNLDEPWSAQVASLLRMYLEEGCNMLFVDTLANTFVGDENKQQDANLYLDALNLFMAHGPVILLHHNTKSTDEYRGSSVLAGKADTMVSLKKSSTNKDVIELDITKQKDGDDDVKFEMKFKPIDLGYRNVWGEAVESPYLVSTDGDFDVLPQDLREVGWLLKAEGPLKVSEVDTKLSIGQASTTGGRLKRLRAKGFAAVVEDSSPQLWEARGNIPDNPEDI